MRRGVGPRLFGRPLERHVSVHRSLLLAQKLRPYRNVQYSRTQCRYLHYWRVHATKCGYILTVRLSILRRGGRSTNLRSESNDVGGSRANERDQSSLEDSAVASSSPAGLTLPVR